MLTLPLTTVVSTITVETNSFVVAQVVSSRFIQICTLFDHDASQDTFDGLAALIGFSHVETFVDGTAGSTSVDVPRLMQLSVANGTFDTLASTGGCDLTTDLTSFSGLVEGPFTSVQAHFDVDDLTLLGTSSVAGLIAADFIFHGDTTTWSRTADSRPFLLTVGASCS